MGNVGLRNVRYSKLIETVRSVIITITLNQLKDSASFTRVLVLLVTSITGLLMVSTITNLTSTFHTVSVTMVLTVWLVQLIGSHLQLLLMVFVSLTTAGSITC